MSPATHREVHLESRPEGALSVDHFRVVEVPVPDPAPGQVLVRNRVMGMAAVMYSMMRSESDDLPMPAFTIGEPMWAPTVGEVVSAPGTDLSAGDLVRHDSGWREYALVDVSSVRRVDGLPDPAAHLSQGGTAWVGVTRGAEVRPGDTVFVSGAAGGVGSMAGQIARLRGAERVIGSTSTEAKAERLVKELGYDEVILRGSTPIEEQLGAAAPDGVDAMFDTVGGEQLRAGLALARRLSRFAIIGGLSGQIGGDSEPIEIDSGDFLMRGITLRGVALFDHFDAIPEWTEVFGRGLRDGDLTFPHTRLPGVDQAPRALCELLEGKHVGAVLVDL